MEKKPRVPKSPNGTYMTKWFTEEQGMPTWDEIAQMWNARSGETLTRSRVWQIAMVAEEKLRQALAGTNEEYEELRRPVKMKRQRVQR